jgi:hypothetical protein
LYDEKGKLMPYTKSYEATLDTSEDKQLSLWQKFKLLGLGGIVLCLAFPATIGAWAIRMFFKGRDNIKQLVIGIEQAKKELPPEQIKILETNLSKKTNTDTKDIVKKLKATITTDDIKI